MLQAPRFLSDWNNMSKKIKMEGTSFSSNILQSTGILLIKLSQIVRLRTNNILLRVIFSKVVVFLSDKSHQFECLPINILWKESPLACDQIDF